MDFKNSIQRLLGIVPTVDKATDEEKTPTSARKWTDAHVRPRSQREIRRQRERDYQAASKRFYKGKVAEAKHQVRVTEQNAVALLRRWEEMHGPWQQNEEARTKVHDFVGAQSSRGDALINERAAEIAKADPANQDPHRVGVLMTDRALMQAADELCEDADRLDAFDARKTFSATPAQVINALGITEEGVEAEEKRVADVGEFLWGDTLEGHLDATPVDFAARAAARGVAHTIMEPR